MKDLVCPLAQHAQHVKAGGLGRGHAADQGDHRGERRKALLDPPVQAGLMGHGAPATPDRRGGVLLPLGDTGIQRHPLPLRQVVLPLKFFPGLLHVGDAARGLLVLSLFYHLQDMKNRLIVSGL